MQSASKWKYLFDDLVCQCAFACWNARGGNKGKGPVVAMGKRGTKWSIHLNIQSEMRWGDRCEVHVFVGSPGYCLLFKARLGNCFHASRVRDYF